MSIFGKWKLQKALTSSECASCGQGMEVQHSCVRVLRGDQHKANDSPDRDAETAGARGCQWLSAATSVQAISPMDLPDVGLLLGSYRAWLKPGTSQMIHAVIDTVGYTSTLGSPMENHSFRIRRWTKSKWTSSERSLRKAWPLRQKSLVKRLGCEGGHGHILTSESSACNTHKYQLCTIGAGCCRIITQMVNETAWTHIWNSYTWDAS